MSGREWKPGDVAMVRLTKSGQREHVAMRDRVGSWASGTTLGRRIEDHEVKAARPLVVIDPEDREQVERLRDEYDRAFLEQNPEASDTPEWKGRRGNAMQAALREFANPTPPKPEEPTGLGAVVVCPHSVYEWARAVRIGDGWMPWFYTDSSGNGESRSWDDLPVVRVLSEGVPEDGAR